MSGPDQQQAEQAAREALARAEAKAERTFERGAWGAQEQADARVEAAAHRLAKVETFGTALPSIVVVYRVADHGPCDPSPSAYCPHCGAAGRYIHHAITSTGERVAAMAGCIQLFPWDRRYAKLSKLVVEAYKREREAKEQGKKLAGWWDGMIGASCALSEGRITVEQWAAAVETEERARQAWLARNGYGRQKWGRR